MKRLAVLLCAAAGLAGAADLNDVHKVYVLKMSRGLDQYLANRLTNRKVFQVVTDPKLADAILTEQIGESLLAKLDEIFPPPPPPEEEKPAKPEKPAKAAKGKAKDADAEDDAEGSTKLMTDTVNKLATPVSSFARGKGTIFLVDAKSKEVVWSAFDLPKNSTSKELDHTASAIVSRIERDLKKK